MWCPRTESNRGPIDYKSTSRNNFLSLTIDTTYFWSRVNRLENKRLQKDYNGKNKAPINQQLRWCYLQFIDALHWSISESLCGFSTHFFANLFYLITTLTSLSRSQIGHSRSLLLPLVLQSRTDSKGVLTRLESIYGLLKATSLVVLDVTYS